VRFWARNDLGTTRRNTQSDATPPPPQNHVCLGGGGIGWARHPAHTKAIDPNNVDVIGAILKGKMSRLDGTSILPQLLSQIQNEHSHI
jgi:hypothetical protein